MYLKVGENPPKKNRNKGKIFSKKLPFVVANGPDKSTGIQGMEMRNVLK